LSIYGIFLIHSPLDVVHDEEWQTIKDHAALRAIYNSPERHDPPKCDPDTRLAIRNKLLDWITGRTDADGRILWLRGAAGTGKSALGQTIAETCASEKLLLASFFFSRTDPSRNTVNALVATLAYQIGTTISGSLEIISEAVKKNSKIFIEPFETQLMDLVFNPLSQLAKIGATPQLPGLIVIDGLNECFDPVVQSQIVLGFVNALQVADHSKFRVLIATRPESHLEATFNSVPSISIRLLTLEMPSVTLDPDDIRLFLGHQFSSLFSSTLPTNVMDDLVERSKGQFVVASTITKYISVNGTDPALRLGAILDIQCPPEDEGAPFAQLDAIYLYILSRVEDVQTTKMILGIILFIDPDYDFFAPLATAQSPSPQTLSGVEYLLSLEPGRATTHTQALYPMVQCTGDGQIFIPQAVVAEFLQDPVRSKSFHIEKSAFLKTLIAYCFEIVGKDTG